MLFTVSIKLCFYLLFWLNEKVTHFKFQWNFTLKSRKFILKLNFFLYLMCYIAHQWFIWTTRNLPFRIYYLYCTKKVPENHNIFFTFVTGVKHTSWCLLRPWFNGTSCLNFFSMAPCVTRSPAGGCLSALLLSLQSLTLLDIGASAAASHYPMLPCLMVNPEFSLPALQTATKNSFSLYCE